ncbi:MAG: phenylacetate--CoA ligase family protein [Terriglobales bacterium]
MLEAVPTILETLVFGKSIARRLAFAPHLPRGLVTHVSRAQFRATMEWVGKRSRFYRERFRELGIEPRRVAGPEALGDFFTTSADLRARPTEDFVCAPPQAGFETTGTTARNKRVYFSNEEVRDIGYEGAVGLWNLGLRPEDRVVDAFDYAFWNAGITLLHSLDRLGCFHVIASKLPPEDFYERVREYEFNVLMVDTAWLVSLTEIAERRGTWPVKFILAGSENLAEATRRWVESVWKAKVYQAYGQTESLGATGIECARQRGYHLNEVNFYFEIVNPNAEGYGELAFTTLTRKVMPLIRYRSNDITRLIQEPCDCPLRTMRRIDKIVGRGDEIVSCGMGMISPWIFETWFGAVPGLADDWQVAVTQPGARDVLELRLEVGEGTAPEALKAALLAELAARFPYYDKNYRMGLYDLRFDFLPRGTMRPAGPRRKLRRVVDERVPAAAIRLAGR